MVAAVLLLPGQPGMAQSLRVDSVAVIDVYGNQKILRPDSLVHLPAQQNYLTFFCSAHRPSPIRYRLQGLDETWTTGLSTDRLHYANLTGGDYEFQLQALPAGQPMIRLPIHINVPFWQRVWFWPMILVYVTGVMGIVIYLFVRYRFLQKLRAIKVRDQIARDLHDDMGSYLSSISILSQTARRNALRDPEKTQSALDTIGQTARQIIDRMGDMVWSINPSYDSMDDVLTRITDVGNSLFSHTDVVCDLAMADDVRRINLSVEARRDFFLIAKEALTNVARYAQASRVRVVVRHEGHDLLLLVQDNGRGFDPTQPTYQNPSGGNGLRNMQVRATALSGILTLDSAPGQGTTLRLLMPLGT